MAKMKPEDLMVIYNNVARNKNLPILPKGYQCSLGEVADRIEWANTRPFPGSTTLTKMRKKFYNSKYPPIWEIVFKKVFKKYGNSC